MTNSPQADAPHWTEPGAHEVGPGIHRIPLPLPMDGLRAVNVYVLETERGLVLIDGGWAVESSRRQLESSLASIGYRVRDITRFLVTHVHRDHYTQASVVRREFGSHVSLGVGDKPTLDLLRDQDLTEDPTVVRLRRYGAVGLGDAWAKAMHGDGPDLSMWDYPDEWLATDHTLDVAGRRLEAISTPGHTQGHYVFADLTDGLLFAGDHVLPTITPSVGFEPVYAELPLGDFLASLVKVRALPDLRLLPAHGPVTESSHARIDELLAHHDERLQLCLDAVESGLETAYDVALVLPWTRHRRRMRELDVFNATLATLETAAHLDLLAARTRIGRTEVDGEVRYAGLPAS
ncbi:MAG TPA: MBL fold metallo-hydrolase [Nocardioidaceae bacterium]|nr:MBL fold metallo-hydrolase [Nocardioidaceae bacterium]